MPTSFYLTILIFIAAGYHFWQARWRGWGIPGMAVVSTVALWYVGDVLYNDYAGYRAVFKDDLLSAAWWQVAWFLVTFSLLVPFCHKRLNRKLRSRRSVVMEMMRSRTSQGRRFQTRLDQVVFPLFGGWLLLMAIALARVEFDFIGLFMPYLGEKAEPWGRGRVGGGIDALFSLANYLQIMLVAVFGVIAALSNNPRTRVIALAVLLLALPYFVIDRTRNVMIAVLLPGYLSWVFLRLRGGIPAKMAALALGLLAVDGWFRFVMESRDKGVSVAAAVSRTDEMHGESSHQGLNMFEELAWMNYFQRTGAYVPNWGQRYFAEMANPIPRVIWKNKPEIGLDYARARGMDWSQASGAEGGVAATISTGMIGQGLANFGLFFGPPAAALLMALWVALLARLDLLARSQPTRLLLYALGCVLTINMGRDITLLVLYPFFFGLMFYHVWKRVRGTETADTAGAGRRAFRLTGRKRQLDTNGALRKEKRRGDKAAKETQRGTTVGSDLRIASTFPPDGGP